MYPKSTGQAAKVLNTDEPHLAELVRRGKIKPEPKVIAGRRLWERVPLFQAAEQLGVLTNDLRARISREEVSRG